MLLPEGFQKISVKKRFSKVSLKQFGSVPSPGASFLEFFHSLPDILAGNWLKQIVEKVIEERKKNKPVMWMMGAHPVKVGVSPWIIRMMQEGVITHLAGNTSVALHDCEIAFFGATSEDVSKGLKEGSFASGEESAEFLNKSARDAKKSQAGLAEQIGKNLLREKPPFWRNSILAMGYKLGIPCTLHGALGTDVPHIHPEMEGSCWGEALMRDFYILCHSVSQLRGGGVVFNIGSAVILPVTFEKALALCRNLHIPVEGFWGVNFDFLQLYRPNLNPVQRARELSGEGFALTAHHEILIPLFGQAVIEYLTKSGWGKVTKSRSRESKMWKGNRGE